MIANVHGLEIFCRELVENDVATNTETKRTIGQQRVPQIRLKHDIDNCLGPFIAVVRASQRRGMAHRASYSW